MRLTPYLPLLLPLMLLAACGDGAEPTEDGRSPSGEILEGTISDDMLPLATVRSEPPLLPPEEQDQDDGEPAARVASPKPVATPPEGAQPSPTPELATTSETQD